MLAFRRHALRSMFCLAALVLPLVLNSVASAQLEGRPIAQPYFDFPNWARWSNCRPHPLMWQFDPFVPYAQSDQAACISGDCGACPPPSNSCVEAFVAHRPNGIYAIADFAPLTYDINHSVEVARLVPLAPALPTTLLTAGDFQGQFDAGSKLTIGYVYSPCVRIEGTYFGTYSFQTTDSARNLTPNAGLGSAGSINTILSNFTNVSGLAGNDFVSLGEFSAFNSAEANIRYWLDIAPGPFDVSLTLGARHVVTREHLALHSESTAPAGGAINDLAIRTDNDMWGGQLGFQVAWLQSAHTWLEFDAKGVMFHNNAAQTTLYTQSLAGVPTPFPTNASGQRTAWMGDLSAAYNIQFHPGLVLRLGYQAIFLNGVALSADNIQSDNNQLRLGPGQLDDAGEVVYHGPFVGLMWNR